MLFYTVIMILILIFASVVVIKDIIENDYKTPNKGEIGENNIEYELNKLTFYKKILRNLYIPYNGKTSEIDLVMLTEFGIYIIESKNFSCWIFGSENDKNWTAKYINETKTFYNPIKQNDGHIKALTKYLQITENEINSLIIFGDGAELKKVPPNTDKRKIIYTGEIEYIFNNEMTKPKIFTADDIEKIYNILEPTTHVTEDVRQQHIADVQQHK